jgi:hypothetical protein
VWRGGRVHAAHQSPDGLSKVDYSNFKRLARHNASIVEKDSQACKFVLLAPPVMFGMRINSQLSLTCRWERRKIFHG